MLRSEPDWERRGLLTARFSRGRFGFFVVVEIEGELPPSAVPEAYFDGVVA